MQPQSLTARPWTMVVGRQLSYLEGNFSGAMLNFGGVYTYIYIYHNQTSMNIAWSISSNQVSYYISPNLKTNLGEQKSPIMYINKTLTF